MTRKFQLIKTNDCFYHKHTACEVFQETWRETGVFELVELSRLPLDKICPDCFDIKHERLEATRAELKAIRLEGTAAMKRN